jgi:hypothetical protein
MNEFTVGQILLKQHLPEALHHYVEKPLDKGGITKLFEDLSKNHSSKFNAVASEMARLGFEVATREGSSVSLEDLKSPIDKDSEFTNLESDIDKIKKKGLTKDKEKEEILKHYFSFTSKMDKDIIDQGVLHNKTLAKIVKAGTRGSVAQYRSTVAAPGLVMNSKQEPMLDFPVKHSFAEGLSLSEYLASAHGARLGEVAKKLSVAKSGFFCLEENTLIRMADYSLKAIKDICVGDLVMGADREGKTFSTKVLNKFDNGIQSVNKYIFRKGKSRKEFIELIATPEHEVLAQSSLPTYNNIEGNFKAKLSCFRKKWSVQPALDRKDLVFTPISFKYLLLGMLLGDGGLTNNNVTLSSEDTKLIDYLNQGLNEENLIIKKINRKKLSYEYIVSEIIKSKADRNHLGHIQGFSHKYKRWLQELNIWGKYSYEKEIPDVTNNSLNEIADLLAGLFIADGCISFSDNSTIPVIILATTSGAMIKKAKELLEVCFGIYSGSFCIRKSYVGKEKFSKSLNAIVRWNHPIYNFVINDKDSILRFFKYIRIKGIKENTLTNLLAKINHKSYRYDGFRFNFYAQENVGKKHVYDIEVDNDDHLYVLANGMIVSNSKQNSRSATTIIVEEHDCGTENGVPFPTSDKESIGAFLARPVLNFKRNNEVTSEMLSELSNKHILSVVVRSPITCQSSRKFHPGAVCQLCAGIRENGLPSIGSYLGINVASAATEPLTQSQLSAKHSSGTASGSKISGGFELVNQIANIPKNFPEAASIAEHDGEVTNIKKADIGGHYLTINNTEHYVHPGFGIFVKKGDHVEKGDVLSEGIIDPSKIAEYKGIGEGRKHYTEAMNKAFKDSGISVNRRNFEVLAKNAIDHVKIIDPEGLGDYLPDQIVSYQALEKNYKPREGTKHMRIDQTKGKYLEVPELHYTIGTPISNSIIKTLKNHDIESIYVHDKPPGFEPQMVRLLDVPEHSDDIFGTLYSTYLHSRLTNAVNTGIGASSDLKGANPTLGLSYGVGFGSSHEKKL